MNNKNKNILACIGIIIGAFVLIQVLSPLLKTQTASDCTTKQVFDTSKSKCRDKTQAEIKQDEEKREKERKEAEVASKKASGSICLSAEESWTNIGKTTCVAYRPGYFYSTGYGRMFINEKENYRTGFTAYLVYNYMTSWDNLLASYSVPMIAVSGTIELYEGHPQIKVYSLSQITIPTKVSCDTSYGCVYRR